MGVMFDRIGLLKVVCEEVGVFCMGNVFCYF